MSDALSVKAPQKPAKRPRSEAYSAKHLDPAKRERILQLLTLKVPKMHIKKATRADFYTIGAIERIAFPDINARRQNAADKAYEALTSSIESAQERAAKGLSGALDVKLLSETWLTLCGEASSITEVQHTFAGLDEFSKEPAIRDVTPTSAD